MGWLARQYGLACDNVVSYTVVTADGEVVTREPTENPDLFWGLRGGGGNFGIVTEFEFQLHHTGTRTLVAEFDFRAEDAVPVLRGWRDLNAAAPRQATFTADVHSTAAARRTVGFVWVGDPARGSPAAPGAARARAARSPSGSTSCPTSTCSDATTPRRPRASAATGRATTCGSCPTPRSRRSCCAAAPTCTRRDLPNAACRRTAARSPRSADADAAFSHRGTAFEFGAGTRWTDPAEDDDRIGAARAAPARPGAVRERRLRQRARATRGNAGSAAPTRRQAGPADRAEEHLRPGQRLPPQPEHPAPRRNTAGRS